MAGSIVRQIEIETLQERIHAIDATGDVARDLPNLSAPVTFMNRNAQALLLFADANLTAPADRSK